MPQVSIRESPHFHVKQASSGSQSSIEKVGPMDWILGWTGKVDKNTNRIFNSAAAGKAIAIAKNLHKLLMGKILNSGVPAPNSTGKH